MRKGSVIEESVRASSYYTLLVNDYYVLVLLWNGFILYAPSLETAR